MAYTTQNQSLLQILTPRHLRGRVMSIYLLDRGLVPLGAVVAGTLAEHFGGQEAIRGLAIIALAIVALVVATHPQILKLQVPLGERLEPRGRAGAGSTAAPDEREARKLREQGD